MALIGQCSEILIELLKIHNIGAVNEDGIVTISEHPSFKLALEVHDLEIPNVVQLDAIFLMGPGKVIREALLGFGETREAALMDAQQYFVDCVFHVWVAALLDTPNAFSTEQTWTISGCDRTVTIGPVSWRGSEIGAKDHRWQKALGDVIQSAKIPEGLHWIDFYYAQNKEEVLACEVLLDNEPWPALDVMREFNWMQSDEFYSVRLFMILKGGFDCADSLTLFASDKEEAGLIEDMAKTVPLSIAERYVRLGSLAFGRHALNEQDIAYSNSAIAATDDAEKGTTFNLSDDWIYVDMQRLARTYPGMMTRELFDSIALRSAEVNAIVQAIDAGQSLANAKFDLPVIPFSESTYETITELPSAKTLSAEHKELFETLRNQ